METYGHKCYTKLIFNYATHADIRNIIFFYQKVYFFPEYNYHNCTIYHNLLVFMHE